MLVERNLVFGAYCDSTFEDFKAWQGQSSFCLVDTSFSELVFSVVCLLANFILNSNLIANICMSQGICMFKHACKT